MKDKALNLGKRILKHELITGSLFVFIGSLLSSFLAFILNLFFARSLTASDYGIYASLISLFTLTIIPAQSISTVIVKFATDYISREKFDFASEFYKKTFKAFFVLSILIFVTFLTLSLSISSFLRIENPLYTAIIGVAICVNYLSIVNGAYIQSLLKFSFSSLILVISAFVRLISGIMLVLIGYRIFGALIAVVLALVTSFIMGFIPVKKIALRKNGSKKIDLKLKEIIIYALPACISVLSLTSLISMDVILVKHFFKPVEAGYYGGLSLIGKIIYYFTGMIPNVMFPLIVKRNSKGQSITNLFYLAIFLVVLPSVAITSFYFIFSEFSVNLILGKSYVPIAPYIGIFAVFITVFSILNVFVNFFLSVGKTIVFIPVFITTLIQVLGIYLFHNSFFQVIGVSLITSSLLLLYLLIYFAKNYFDISAIKKTLSISSSPTI